MKAALERLGFGPCYHMAEVLAHAEHGEPWLEAGRSDDFDWESIFGPYRATVDWPACAFWRDLASAYPEAKVLLSVRDPRRWWESFSSTILRQMALPEPDEEGFTAAFEEHNAEVVRAIPPERLLVYRVTEGWGPLCGFLGVPVPDEEFPNVNDREFFSAVFGLGP